MSETAPVFEHFIIMLRSWDNIVGVSSYGLDGLGFEFWQGQGICCVPKLSVLALGRIQPPIKVVFLV